MVGVGENQSSLASIGAPFSTKECIIVFSGPTTTQKVGKAMCPLIPARIELHGPRPVRGLTLSLLSGHLGLSNKLKADESSCFSDSDSPL
jgi:hypothetical protein